ncbi:MAG: alpha-N-arabinofuranosidase [Ruminococcaceae bacterium]|nr:alpha-N-arabinofuranosidase [Oscillospiraceae bacterium]
MIKSKIRVNSEYVIGKTDSGMFGSFLEHVGRAIYNGIYDPKHPLADSMGFRKDVAEAVKELNISVIRYPGGNFVSGYNWEDGVGPIELRPKKLELAWNSVETNMVGTDEFCTYCKKIGSEPMLAVNLGTRGPDEARQLVEYCNSRAGTKYADMRIANGYKEPHNVKYWCLGNEMDGPWQIGRKTAYEYGRVAEESAKLMKLTDPSIKLIVCGSSSNLLPTHPDWEREVLELTYDSVDYISMHSYYENANGDTPSFVASNAQMEKFIQGVLASCDFVKAKKRSNKTMMISYDEWNIWYQFSRKQDVEPWQVAPHLFEDIYSMEDAVALGGLLITMMRHCDRIKLACLAQLVNVIAPIMTDDTGAMWKQTTFYPFMHASKYGRGTVLNTITNSETYDCIHGTVPYVESLCVFGEDESITVFVCNRSEEQDCDFDIILENAEEYSPESHIVMTAADKNMSNTAANPFNVVPTSVNDINGEKGTFNVKIPSFSWNVLRFTK